MVRIPHRVIAPGLVALGSFAAIILLMGLTNPIKNISFAAVFFVLAYILIYSSVYTIAALQFGKVGHTTRRKIGIISTLLVLVTMLRSLQSFGLVDLLVVALIGFGLVFYVGRRN